MSFGLRENCAYKLGLFEKQRMIDTKKSITRFMKQEMDFFAKALQLCSDAYKYVLNIDEESDMGVKNLKFQVS